MKKFEGIASGDPKHTKILSESDNEQIKNLTKNIESVPEEVREIASQDVLETLQNNHPLNKVWRDEDGEITGYLAFEDFKEKEAYVKYFSTNGETGESVFSFLPELIEKAKSLGYQKIGFHGFNKRLNKISGRFGFERQRTDTYQGVSADYYEIDLNKTDSSEESKQKMIEAFKTKAREKVLEDIEKTRETLDQAKQQKLRESFDELLKKIQELDLTDTQKAILELKLARYFQREDQIDVNTLADALIETPSFLDKTKGGFHRLLEIHQQKTLEKIAEMRRKKAEQTGNEEFNPYEALFQTDSGEYYMARLLNMPHLEEESQYMNHCVGTSDSYINKMKRGDVEILSFRKTPQINSQTQKLEGDEPIITIEYNVRTKTIQQVKKHSDEYIRESDPYFQDFIKALKKLKDTQHDTGEKRDFKEISNSELGNIKVKDYHLFTEQGEIHFDNFDPDSNLFVLKMGKMNITKETPKKDASKIFRIVEGIQFKPEEIAYGKDEVNENTKVYIGEWNPTIFQTIKQFPNITHLYESFPDKKIFVYTLETDSKIQTPEQAEEQLINRNIYLSDWGKDILQKTEFSKEKQEYNLVQFTLAQLGFPSGATTDEIYTRAQELGLELCPAEVGPQLRLFYPGKDWKIIAMKQIPGRRGHPGVFHLDSGDGGLGLLGRSASPGDVWSADYRLVFVAS